jgi:ABC-type polysaccharide/polyol phosphate export permease
VVSLYILAGITLICYVAIVGLLARQYFRTRDLGLIWLAVAVVIWPFVSRMLQTGEKVFIDRLVRHQPVDFFPFSLVEKGQLTLGSLMLLLTYTQQLIGVALLLVAVLYLSKMKTNRLSAIIDM